MTDQLNSIISSNISRHRKQQGITQEQLAKQLGVSAQAVSKWENGQSCPDISLLPLLADIFGLTIDDLFGRKTEHIDLRAGLVLEYLFEGNVLDTSGFGLHGQVEGAQFCPDRFGRKECALYFDGQDDYVLLESPPVLNSKAFSISLWCNYDSTTVFDGWHSALISQDSSDQRVFQLSTRDEYLTFHRFLAAPDLVMNSKIQKEYWYHIVVTFENNLFRKFVNGVLVAERSGNFTPSTTEPIYIGRKATDEPYFFFKGKMDDVRIYNRAIHQAEVEALYLEHGWRPLPLPPSEVEAKSLPALEKLEDIRMTFPSSLIKEAAQWYKENLGFKTLVEEEHFVFLTLHKGSNLLLDQVAADHVGRWQPNKQASFIFKTNRSIEDLYTHLSGAGAVELHVRDGGFATFLDFQDPFGYAWMVMNEK